ncbi:TlpA family protein disulfide reductase [Microbacterium sp.]|uniref:TlpA family protein disulfide reductase n=1 Tax=Microbacterium sp. TaxID=51671 RepID=UPI0039E6D924
MSSIERRRVATRRTLAAALAVATAVTLAACSNDATRIAEGYQQGGNTGFVSGDGRLQEIPLAERGDPVEFSGTAVDGSTVSSKDLAGDVVVLNFWYAGCGPCRIEAPLLEKTYAATRDEGARFLGINIYDGPEQATSFEKTYGVTYPSLLARDDTDLKLAFTAWTSLSAVPTTLVLDRQGRVAARFIGAVRDDTSLPTIIGDVLAESP